MSEHTSWPLTHLATSHLSKYGSFVLYLGGLAWPLYWKHLFHPFSSTALCPSPSQCSAQSIVIAHPLPDSHTPYTHTQVCRHPNTPGNKAYDCGNTVVLFFVLSPLLNTMHDEHSEWSWTVQHRMSFPMAVLTTPVKNFRSWLNLSWQLLRYWIFL